MIETYTPAETEDGLREALANYCETSFPIARAVRKDDPIDLVSSLKAFLRGKGKYEARFLQAPYVERIMPYARTRETETLDKLVGDKEGSGLHPELAKAIAKYWNTLPSKVRLYEHQRDAFVNLDSREFQHLVVCSGTGSGKTESFLIPMLNSIVWERERFNEKKRSNQDLKWRGGVRALILYPMNALVEDQVGRIRRIIRALPSELRPTFGHYTSRLEKEESECVSDAKLRTALQDFTQDVKQKEVPLEELEEISLECEYRSREEWSEMPADIIVTNNAMLERLLLRPDANGIFETQDEEGHSTWRYIIIDEAHSYTGATGTEIGWLIRRLKNRTKVDNDRIHFFATSATLKSKGVGETDDDVKKWIAREFAAKIFPITDVGKVDVELGRPMSMDEICSSSNGCELPAREILASKYGEGDRTLFEETVRRMAADALAEKNRDLAELIVDGCEYVAVSLYKILTSVKWVDEDGVLHDLSSRECVVKDTQSLRCLITFVLESLGTQDDDWKWKSFLYDPLREGLAKYGNDLAIKHKWEELLGLAEASGEMISAKSFCYLYRAAMWAIDEHVRRGTVNSASMRDIAKCVQGAVVTLGSDDFAEELNAFKEMMSSADKNSAMALLPEWKALLGDCADGDSIPEMLYNSLNGRDDVRKCCEVLSDSRMMCVGDGQCELPPETGNLLEQLPLRGAESLEEKRNELYSLFQLCMIANVPGYKPPVPLLDVRYHQMVRGISDVAIAFGDQMESNGKKHISIYRADDNLVPGCGSDAPALFSLAVCRECGQPYIMGYLASGAVANSNVQTLMRRQSASYPECHVFAWHNGVDDVASRNNREQECSDAESVTVANSGQEKNKAQANRAWVNLRSGEVAFGAQPVANAHDFCEMYWHRKAGARSFVEKCPNCGRKQPLKGNEAYEYGTIAPYEAVGENIRIDVLEEFVRHAAPDTNPAIFHLPGRGRKVLTFADSRSGAASFPTNFDKVFQRRFFNDRICEIVYSSPPGLTVHQRERIQRQYDALIADIRAIDDVLVGRNGPIQRLSALRELDPSYTLNTREELERSARLLEEQLKAPSGWMMAEVGRRLKDEMEKKQLLDMLAIVQNRPLDGVALPLENDVPNAAHYRIIEALTDFGRTALYKGGKVEVRARWIDMQNWENFPIGGIASNETDITLLQQNLKDVAQAVFNCLFRDIEIVLSERDIQAGMNSVWNDSLLHDYRTYYTVGDNVGAVVDRAEQHGGNSEPRKDSKKIHTTRRIRRAVIEAVHKLPGLQALLNNGEERAPVNNGGADPVGDFLKRLLRKFVEGGLLVNNGVIPATAAYIDFTALLGLNNHPGIYLVPASSEKYVADERYKTAERIRIEEHTAQIDVDTGAVYQQAFTNGQINVLSCSTTFEMGIDVGQLSRVFMLNAPPSTANYRQRAGRAGRRPGAAAYILTFAGRGFSAARSFAEPWTLYNGAVETPQLFLTKRTFWSRHLRAEALHCFLDWWQKQRPCNTEELWNSRAAFFFGHKKDGDYPPVGDGPIVNKILTWAESQYGEECDKMCKDLVMSEGIENLHSAVADLVFQIFGFESGFDRLPFPDGERPDQVASNLLYQYQELSGPVYPKIEDNALKEDDNVLRQCVIRRVRNFCPQRNNDAAYRKYVKKQIIDLLSSANVLPRYGFPADTMELKIPGSENYWDPEYKEPPKRDPRAALYEYAPGRNVYINKHVYRVTSFSTEDDINQRRIIYCSRCKTIFPSVTVGLCPECSGVLTSLPAVHPKSFRARFAGSSKQGAQGQKLKYYSGQLRNPVKVGDDLNLWLSEPSTLMMDFYNPNFDGSGYGHGYRDGVDLPQSVALCHELNTDVMLLTLPDLRRLECFVDNSNPEMLSPRAKAAIHSVGRILRRVLAVSVLKVNEREFDVEEKLSMSAEDGYGTLPPDCGLGSSLIFFDTAQGGGGVVLPISRVSTNYELLLRRAVNEAILLCETATTPEERGVQSDIPLDFAEWRNRERDPNGGTTGYRLEVFRAECFSADDARDVRGLDVLDAWFVFKAIRGDVEMTRPLVAADADGKRAGEFTGHWSKATRPLNPFALYRLADHREGYLGDPGFDDDSIIEQWEEE